jgi:hypothetical protein
MAGTGPAMTEGNGAAGTGRHGTIPASFTAAAAGVAIACA